MEIGEPRIGEGKKRKNKTWNPASSQQLTKNGNRRMQFHILIVNFQLFVLVLWFDFLSPCSSWLCSNGLYDSKICDFCRDFVFDRNVFNRVLELHFSRMKIADHVALYTWMKSKINPTTISGKMLLAGINFTWVKKSKTCPRVWRIHSRDRRVEKKLFAKSVGDERAWKRVKKIRIKVWQR
jgi:hypothetical protein